MTPVPIIVTHEIGGRRRPVAGDVVHTVHVAFGENDALMLAVLDMVQRQACEAAQLAWLAYPKSAEFMEGESGRKGWRAYLPEDTAHLIRVLEEWQIATFSEAETEDA